MHLQEEFALADDRAAVLEHQVPGTEEAYLHRCVLLQQQGRLDEVDAILETWRQRLGHTNHHQEITDRQALLRWREDPQGTLDRLRRRLGARFDHEREEEGPRATAYPTALDPELIAGEALADRALARHTDLGGFTDLGLERLLERDLDGDRRRHLLARLQRPDFPRLAKLVVQDLQHRHSGGFGSHPVHRRLTLQQLGECLRLWPDLAKVEAFVHTWLVRLHPGPDVEWEHDLAQRQAYLERLLAFVLPLAPSFNSLKAHVLYHRLDLDRRLGVFDRERLVQYLQLPRSASYMEPKWLQVREHRDHPADLRRDYRSVTLLPAVNDDEPLVRHLLDTLLAEREDWRPFETWVRDAWLTDVFATAKVLRGLGDKERWTSLLGPSRYQALRDRVDIELAPTCKTTWKADEPVTLAVDVKNAPTLVVKVFEVNTLNYVLSHGRDVDTTIDLDGLVPTEEQALAVDEPPFRRVRRELSFPSLGRAGTFVVELIGGGKSSRALIRKGGLRHVQRLGAAGHAFTIFDDEGRPAPDATLWMAGREYRPDARGTIHVPFTASPRRQQVLLRRGDLTTLETFDHRRERYALSAGLHVEREALVRRRQAQVLVRAALTVDDVPVSLDLLEERALVIESTDRQGTQATRTVLGVELSPDRETVHELQVPEGLAELTITLRGKVKALSTGEKVEVSASRTFTLNGIDATDQVEDLHLARTDRGWVLHVLGKAGEPRPDAPVTVWLSHREVTDEVDAALQTDARGRVELGRLHGIVTVRAERPGGHSRTWTLPQDRCRVPRTLHAREGDDLLVPVPGDPDGVSHRTFALLERCRDGYLADHQRALHLRDGVLEVRGLPPGDHELMLKESGEVVTLRVTPGEAHEGWIVSRRRLLEVARRRPLRMTHVEVGDDALRVRLVGASKGTRLHALATRFLPEYAAFDDLDVPLGPEPRAVSLGPEVSSYVSGRDLGDEYRYVLDRKYAKKRPGVMLARPGLLLNPWALRDTDTGRQDAAGGGAYARAGGAAMRGEACADAAPEPEPAEGSGHANLDWLPHAPAVLLNLPVEAAEGGGAVVSVPRAALAHASLVRLVAVDPLGLATRDVALPEVHDAPQDVRLRLGLDPQAHFTQQKQVTLLAPGQALVVEDITTSKLEVYDALPRVHALFHTLNPDPQLQTFRFVLDWPRLSHEEKCAKLDEHGCHELHLFIARKDPAFFEQVVRPHLRNKKEKTFVDRWLLGEDLSAYRRPWAHGQLNVVERILLGERLAEERAAEARHVADRLEAQPPDPERDGRLFRTALQGSALDADDALGFGAAAAAAEDTRLAEVTVTDYLATGKGFGGGGPMRAMMMAAPAAPPPPPGMAPPSPKRAAEKSKKSARRERARDVDKAEEAEQEEAGEGFSSREGVLEDMFGDLDDGERDLEAREAQRPLYRRPEVTKELAENNWYRRPIEQQGPDLIPVNAFWRDWAARAPGAPFLSAHVAQATSCFAEMMLALTALDLPFEAARPSTTYEGARLTLRTPGPAIVFHEELRPAAPSARAVPVLVSQGYLRPDDRYEQDPDGQTVEKYATGELLAHVVYTCRVVLTNPSAAHRKLDVLLQIPRGAVPVSSGFTTRGVVVHVPAYGTQSAEYSFYFPAPGTYGHFPAHVSRNEELVASAEPRPLTVVEEPSTVDTTSWAWVSQRGTDDDVLAFLEQKNVEKLDLSKIAWRMKDRGFHERALALLERRHVYHPTLWSYALYHGHEDGLREHLLHQDGLLRGLGAWFDSPLVTVDPVRRRWFEQREYAPLINARAHALGAKRKILNDRFAQQWAGFMSIVGYRTRPTHADWLAITYYLLLQDRVDEALAAFGRVDPRQVETALQLDYARAYLAIASGDPAAARQVALAYDDYPLARWRNLFRRVLAQVDEVERKDAAAAGGAGAPLDRAVIEERDAAQRQGALAASEPALELTVEQRTVTLRHANLRACRVNYYLMDVELLFSRQPFVQQQSGQFSFVRPNRSDVVALDPAQGETALELPVELRARNVIVEVVAGALRRSQAHYAHALSVHVVEQYGEVRVTRQQGGAPVPAAYVKVYARLHGGAVRFYKDGYTDLRGRFDYASLSTNELGGAERFALLVLSDEHGAVIREATPPKE